MSSTRSRHFRHRNNLAPAVRRLMFKDRMRAVLAAGAIVTVITSGTVVVQSFDPHDSHSTQISNTAVTEVASDGTWQGQYTVNGQIFVDRGGLQNFHNNGDEFKNGVTIKAYFIDKDGAVSPTYTTTSKNLAGQAGRYSILMKPWTDANGKVHTFEAIPGEQLRVWAVAPNGYTISHTESYPIGTSTKRDNAAWNLASGANRVYNWEISLQELPTDWQWREPATRTDSSSSIQDDGGWVRGTIYWDQAHTWGATAYPQYNPGLGDVPAPNVEVIGSYVNDEVARRFDAWLAKNSGASQKAFQAAQQQILADYQKETGQSGIAETVRGFTDTNGNYLLQFNGIYGNSYSNAGTFADKSLYGKVANSPTDGTWYQSQALSKHINAKYMYVFPTSATTQNVTMASMQVPMFQNITDTDLTDSTGVIGAAGVLFNYSNVNFPMHPGTPKFDVVNYDNTNNPARPGDTAYTSASGLVPNTPYTVKWWDEQGNVVKEEKLITDGIGNLPKSTYTVDPKLAASQVYTATLLDKAGQEFAADSFIALPFKAVTPIGSVGDAYSGSIAQSIPAGAKVNYAASNLPPGLTMDPATGKITGTPTTAGTWDVAVVSTITTADGQTLKLNNTVPISITDVPLVNGIVGDAYVQKVEPTGLPEGSTYTLKSAENLPAGLSFNPATGTITGTPTVAGTADNVKLTYDITLPDGTVVKNHVDDVSLKIAPPIAPAQRFNATNEPDYQDTAVVQGTQILIPLPINKDGSAVPTGSQFVPGPNFPAWATLNADGSISAAPGTDVPAGPVTMQVVVVYPDGSNDLIDVVVDVKQAPPKAAPLAETNDPSYQPTTVVAGSAASVPAPLNSNGSLPPTGSAFTADPDTPNWVKVNSDGSLDFTPPKGTAAGEYTVPVVVTYPDGSKETITATINVTAPAPARQATTNEPVYDPITVLPGTTAEVPSPLNFDGTAPPAGTKFTGGNADGAKVPDWIQVNPDGSLTVKPGSNVEPGDYAVPITVTYPDGSTESIAATVTVSPTPPAPSVPQNTVYDPKYQDNSVVQGAEQNIPAPVDSTGLALPTGTKFALDAPAPGWVTIGEDGSLTAKPGTDVAPGDYPVSVEVTYPDGTTERVTTTIKVTPAPQPPAAPNDQTFNPVYADSTVLQGDTATLPAPLDNGQPLPEGTKFAPGADVPAWATVNPDGTITVNPTDSTPTGDTTIKVLVTYPDGTSETVTAAVKVAEVPAPPAPEGKLVDAYQPTYTPESVVQGVPHEVPAPLNTDGAAMPAGTKFTAAGDTPAWVTVNEDGSLQLKADENVAPGEYSVPIQVTYTDGTSEVVNVKVTVSAPSVTPDPEVPDNEANAPTYPDVSIQQGAERTIPAPLNADGTSMPSGTTFEQTGDSYPWVTVNSDGTLSLAPGADVTPGDYPVTVKVTYPDGTTDTVTMKLSVTAKPADQTTDPTTNSVDAKYQQDNAVKAGDSSVVPVPTDANNNPLPAGTTFEGALLPDWAKVNSDGSISLNPPADVTTSDVVLHVRVIYPDGSRDIVTVPVHVEGVQTPPALTQASSYQPVYPTDTTARAGSNDPVNIPAPQWADGKAPDDAKFALADGAPSWMTVNPDGSITVKPGADVPAGDYLVPVVVTYPDGTNERINVPVAVTAPSKQQTYTPVYAQDTKVEAGKTVDIAVPSWENDLKPSQPVSFAATTGAPAGVTVNQDGSITFAADEKLAAGTYVIPVEVTYADGSQEVVTVPVVVSAAPGTSVPPVVVDASTYQPTYGAPTTVKAGETATVSAPNWGDNKPNGDVKFTAGDTSPSWAAVNPDGSIDVKPGDNVPAGTYIVPVVVTYPDGTTEIVNVPVIVEAPAVPSKTNPELYQPVYPTNNSVEAGKELSVSPKWENDKSPAGPTTFSPGVAYPSWATVTPEGTVIANPSESVAPGTYYMPVVVTYPDGLKDYISVPIEVTNSGTTTPSVQTDNTRYHASYPTTTVNAGGEPVTTAPVWENRTVPGGGTTFTKGQNAPEWATVNPDGSITIQPGADVPPGNYVVPVVVKYPDGSEDIVYAPVSVGNPTVPSTTHDVDVYQPVYVTDTTVKPNDVHDIPAPKDASGAEFPAGTTFALGDQHPVSAKSINPQTGEIHMEVPSWKKPGTYYIPVVVTYPDGTTETVNVPFVVESTAAPEDPSASTAVPVYGSVQASPGQQITTLPPVFTDNGKAVDTPAGTTFTPGPGAPTDMKIGTDGAVTVTVPKDAQPGTLIRVPVIATVPGADPHTAWVEINVTPAPLNGVSPIWTGGSAAAGATVAVPNTGGPVQPGTTVSTDGPGEATLNPDGSITVKVNPDAAPGSVVVVTVKDSDGKVIDTIQITVAAPENPGDDTTTPEQPGNPGDDTTTPEQPDKPGGSSIDPLDKGIIAGIIGAIAGGALGSSTPMGPRPGTTLPGSAAPSQPGKPGKPGTSKPNEPGKQGSSQPGKSNGSGKPSRSGTPGDSGANVARPTQPSTGSNPQAPITNGVSGGNQGGREGIDANGSANNSSRSGQLAMTGLSGLAITTGIALAALLAGGALMLLRRRREED
ncbi:Rib/alpha-like domain-containing protein [uncultured Corynebacterium sp.]|uniref:Rib/alpha-like domain-containing protein n=1 Tax=uncultured Corynebacterium sp. TaxID=159447 RepID=UPI0025E514A2|nr:Rib/alpha-like domain-containing protein [uncultured Corynebacterium sp.]